MFSKLKEKEKYREHKYYNKIDVAYRDLTDFDNQWFVMCDILSCLTDKQLEDIKQNIYKMIQAEKKAVLPSK